MADRDQHDLPASTPSAAAQSIVGMMYAIHGAILRDLDRLVAALPVSLVDGTQVMPAAAVLAYWRRFTDQLEHHHEVEDAEVWPHLRDHLGGRRPAAVVAMDLLQGEHGRIVSAQRQADAALVQLTAQASRGALGTARLCVVAFRDLVRTHLQHEEVAVVPLLMDRTDDAYWAAFRERRQADPGPDEFLPWLLDGAAPEVSAHIRTRLPERLVELLDSRWQPAHQRMVAALSDRRCLVG